MAYRQNYPQIPLEWNRHSRELQALSRKSLPYLLREISKHPDMSEEQFIILYKDTVDRFGAQAANSAMRALELSRISAGAMGTLPRPESAWEEIPRDQIERTVTWGLRKLDTWDALALAQFLGKSGSFERNILRQARKTVFYNTQRAGTRYARIPGPFACPFCLMLASRGAAYLTAESATSKANGERFHDGCHCIAIECLTQDDVPSFIHELEQEWNNTAGQVTTGSADQQRAWTQYLHSSRPYQVRAGHTMKNVMTVRPTPSVLQAPGQIHLYKRGKSARSEVNHRNYSAEQLRQGGLVGRRERWSPNERDIAVLIEKRSGVRSEYCAALGQLPSEQQDAFRRSLGLGKEFSKNTPDILCGDITIEAKQISGTSKNPCGGVIANIRKAQHQSDHVVVDSRNFSIPREELIETIESDINTDHYPKEFLVLGTDDEGDYELIWP